MRSAHAPRWVKRLPLRVKRTFFKNPFSHGSASTRSECNCTNLWKPTTIFLFGRHIVRRKRKQRRGGGKTTFRGRELFSPPPYPPERGHGGGEKRPRPLNNYNRRRCPLILSHFPWPNHHSWPPVLAFVDKRSLFMLSDGSNCK